MSDGMSDMVVRDRREVFITIRRGLRIKCEVEETRSSQSITVKSQCPWWGRIGYDEKDLKKDILKDIAHAEYVMDFLKKNKPARRKV